MARPSKKQRVAPAAGDVSAAATAQSKPKSKSERIEMARPSKKHRVAPAAATAASAQSKPKSKNKSRAVTPAHPPPRQAPRVLGHESPLLSVLHLGNNCVLQFLTLRDAPSLLNCCHAFRHDAELALHALLADSRHRHISAHLQQQCELDWCDLGTLRASTGYDKELTIYDEDCCTHGCVDTLNATNAKWQAVRAQCAATHRSALLTQFVTLVAAFNKRVLRLCDSLRMMNNHVGRGFYSTIPVLIPLMAAPSTELLLLPDDAVRKALNALHAGFGDAFVRNDAPPFASLFGAHWDHIQRKRDAHRLHFGKRSRAAVKCRLCKAKDLALFTRQERQYKSRDIVHDERRAERREARYESSEEELTDDVWFAMMAKQSDADSDDNSGDDSDCESDDAYYDGLMAERRASGVYDDYSSHYDDSENDDTVKKMVAAGDVRFESLGCGAGFSPVKLAKALESRGHVEICKDFAQPLKRFLLAHCTRVRRVRCPWIAAPQTSNKRTVGEFVGGVTASGILCGVLVVRDSYVSKRVSV